MLTAAEEVVKYQQSPSRPTKSEPLGLVPRSAHASCVSVCVNVVCLYESVCMCAYESHEYVDVCVCMSVYECM